MTGCLRFLAHLCCLSANPCTPHSHTTAPKLRKHLTRKTFRGNRKIPNTRKGQTRLENLTRGRATKGLSHIFLKQYIGRNLFPWNKIICSKKNKYYFFSRIIFGVDGWLILRHECVSTSDVKWPIRTRTKIRSEKKYLFFFEHVIFFQNFIYERLISRNFQKIIRS